MKLFFLGGSFDPPHLGHLAMAERCAGRYDKFLFIPAKRSPLKTSAPVADDSQRVRMLELMVAHLPHCSIDRYELQAAAPSYTLDTVQHLQRTYNFAELHLLIGADQLATFDQWYGYQQILESVKLVCFHRGSGTNISPAISVNFEMIEDFHWGQSSTAIRNKLKAGDSSAADDLHPAVYHYIIEQKLYS